LEISEDGVLGSVAKSRKATNYDTYKSEAFSHLEFPRNFRSEAAGLHSRIVKKIIGAVSSAGILFVEVARLFQTALIQQYPENSLLSIKRAHTSMPEQFS
jgi:hypothetical protein